MPAVVYDLAPLTTVPSSVYLDTSVLLAAYRAGAKPSPTPPEQASRAFIVAATTARPDAAWTSILAIEEACWWPIAEEIRGAANRLKVSPSRLKRDHQREYARAYRAARPKADQLMHFLKGLPVHVRHPRVPRSTSAQPARAICYLVHRLFRLYDLEMADLFHIAIAKLDGTDAIATLDKGFLDVDGIEVYTYP